MTGCRIIPRSTQHIAQRQMFRVWRDATEEIQFLCAKCDDGGRIVLKRKCLSGRESVWGSCHFPHNSLLLWRHFRQVFLLLFSLLSGPFWVGESENGRANSGMKRSIFRAVHTHNALAEKKSNDGCWWRRPAAAHSKIGDKIERTLIGLHFCKGNRKLLKFKKK